MKKNSAKDREERYRKLPDLLKEAMVSMDTVDKIEAIGRKFGLTVEKMGFMSDTIGDMILGLLHPEEFTNVLAERLGMEKNKARVMASQINQEIFFALRQELKKSYQFDLEEEGTPSEANIPATQTKTTPTSIPSLPSPRPSTSPVREPIDLRQTAPQRPVPPDNAAAINLKELTSALKGNPTQPSISTPPRPALKVSESVPPLPPEEKTQTSRFSPLPSTSPASSSPPESPAPPLPQTSIPPTPITPTPIIQPLEKTIPTPNSSTPSDTSHSSVEKKCYPGYDPYREPTE